MADGSGSNPGPEKDQPSASQSPSEGRQPRILIIEDNKTDVFLIREAIGSCGIDAEIEVLRDGQAALNYFEQVDAQHTDACPDLILLDMNLPRRSGDEVLKHLRTSTKCRHSNVLIVSSSDAPQDRQAVETSGVAGYFRKPSSYDEFMKLGPLVRTLLDSGPRKTHEP
ncbi:MAG TPA: response regulator [Bryobacteraceae bacterium]|nr:response regulator [Bryobacteraceae bacterium]